MQQTPSFAAGSYLATIRRYTYSVTSPGVRVPRFEKTGHFVRNYGHFVTGLPRGTEGCSTPYRECPGEGVAGWR